ncbi:tRNA (cytidine(34)-2'-O)-methyltransferase [Phenylobacterium montanum]|uniref:tRNA (cytidine(34)-2'-O)-methyltransferase n=1 Tax=Phenylobacterium montanum TaxID=2823693 RepID=A0A975FY09_9CAUL|nr:tRNA (cytidine(34)-2'-O)-methyltransferase [Caulobacter sp. S6]QUD87246.1 tRNA (cytidine(34)-2'-O)-methyltransferase [Caulobacter sp. S6]
MRLALFQPDIPQNVGASLRLCACLHVDLEIIEPCAFPLTDRALKRTAMDYAGRAAVIRRRSWAEFLAAPERGEGRLVLFTTKAAEPYAGFSFQPGDTLLMGQESAGAPDFVHEAAQARLIVPIAPETRSLNIVTAAAMGLGEALRQTQGFPVRAVEG